VPTDHLLIDRMFMPRSALQFRAAPASMGLVRIRDSVFGGLGAGSLLDHEPRGGRGDFEPAWLENTRVLAQEAA